MSLYQKLIETTWTNRISRLLGEIETGDISFLYL